MRALATVCVVSSLVSCSRSPAGARAAVQRLTPTPFEYQIAGRVTPPYLVANDLGPIPDSCTHGRPVRAGIWLYEASISETGEPQQVKALDMPDPSEAPCPEWEHLARSRIAALRYHPAMLDGRPVRVHLVIDQRIDFR